MRKLILLLTIVSFFSITVFSQTDYNGIKQNTICLNGEVCLGDSIAKAILIFGEPDGIRTVDKSSDEEWTERPQKEYKFGREFHKKDNGNTSISYELRLYELLNDTQVHILIGFHMDNDKYFLSVEENKFQVGMKLEEETLTLLDNLSHYASFDKETGTGQFLIFILDKNGKVMNDVSDFKIGFENYIITYLSAKINLE